MTINELNAGLEQVCEKLERILANQDALAHNQRLATRSLGIVASLIVELDAGTPLTDDQRTLLLQLRDIGAAADGEATAH
jgi:hypothetical protein